MLCWTHAAVAYKDAPDIVRPIRAAGTALASQYCACMCLQRRGRAAVAAAGTWWTWPAHPVAAVYCRRRRRRYIRSYTLAGPSTHIYTGFTLTDIFGLRRPLGLTSCDPDCSRSSLGVSTGPGSRMDSSARRPRTDDWLAGSGNII